MNIVYSFKIAVITEVLHSNFQVNYNSKNGNHFTVKSNFFVSSNSKKIINIRGFAKAGGHPNKLYIYLI